MKNKKLVYLLLPLTVIVWGIIFYKIVSGIGDEEFVNPNLHPHRTFLNNVVPSENLQLIANYRDPFLSKNNSIVTHKRRGNTNPLPPVGMPAVNVAPMISWPQFSYVGLIENKKKGSKIAIVRIDNSEILIKEKEIVHNVLIEKIFKDSIQVVFNKEKKVFKK